MKPSSARQSEIDRGNAEFWGEPCGTTLPIGHGIGDATPRSLELFDTWYFKLYPYLFRHIPFEDMRGKAVLEIGPGYGSIAQKLAEAGCLYHALDIADGPLRLTEKRLQRLGVDSDLRQGSVLQPPHAAETFDWIVAIDCLHHTGNLEAALRQVHRMLKPGGQAVVMVYHAASYRQWLRQPVSTLRRIKAPPSIAREPESSTNIRRLYDANSAGAAAPQAEFVTRAEFHRLCSPFSLCESVTENIGSEGLLRLLPRPVACRLLGPKFGLDIYGRLRK